MKYTIFNNVEVNVDETLILEYEGLFSPVMPYTVEYMALSEGVSADDSIPDIERAVSDGFNYEIFFATHTPDEISRALECEVIR